jgi:hypothetical protein
MYLAVPIDAPGAWLQRVICGKGDGALIVHEDENNIGPFCAEGTEAKQGQKARECEWFYNYGYILK